MKFTDFGLSPLLLKGISDAGFTDCLPVQERTIGLVLQGRDVTVRSQTGSGKTAAFLIPLFELLSRAGAGRRALIIAPTRELAVQIEDEAKLLGAHLAVRIACFYGGVGYDRQERMLDKGVDIIIGTPGRLIDLNLSGKLRFDDVGMLVIDEADRLFDMGFLPDLRRILKRLPPAADRQTMLFSATLAARVQELAYEHMHDPVAVEIQPEQVTVETVEQQVYHVARDEKMRLLIGLLKKINPGSALIFTNMKSTAAEAAWRLNSNGFGCEYIIGDLPQKKRLGIINAMKAGTINILVATDVAARGLHINDLDLVVNYDLPENPESYVHRIGRTARVGNKGRAITLVCERYVYGLEAIESLIGMKIPVVRPSDDDFARDVTAGRRLRDLRQSTTDAQRREKPGARTRRTGSPQRRGAEKDALPDRRHTVEKGDAAQRSEKKRSRRRKDSRKKRQAPHEQAQHRGDDRAAAKPSRERRATMHDRLAYYQKKYGDTFTPAAAAEGGGKKRRRRKIIDAIKRIFTRKKTKA